MIQPIDYLAAAFTATLGLPMWLDLIIEYLSASRAQGSCRS